MSSAPTSKCPIRRSCRAVPLDRRVRIDRAAPCTVPFFRFLYREVGQQYNWHDRFVWTDEQCPRASIRRMSRSRVLYTEGTPAGYFELQRHADASVEIVYFGLMPDFLGRGLGKQMLTAAVQRSWAMGAERVWLHTCTQDNPAALPNYVRGDSRRTRRRPSGSRWRRPP